MRKTSALLLTALLAGPAAAWEFTPVPVCTLRATGEAETGVEVTWDPARPEPYAITVTADTPWPNEATFGLAFEGGRALIITTDRQQRSTDGLSLTVTDRGFGNVLAGLEFNATATAFSGEMTRRIPLEAAPEPVRAFRACTSAPVA